MIKAERAERKALTEAILKLVDAIDRLHISTLPASQIEEVLDLDTVEAEGIDIGAGINKINSIGDPFSIKNTAILILEKMGPTNSSELLRLVNLDREKSLRPTTNIKGLTRATTNFVVKNKGIWYCNDAPAQPLKLKQFTLPNME